MPLYSFACRDHGQVDVIRPMSAAHLPEQCSCGLIMTRVFEPPMFIEDRCRFARNPKTGEDFSDMLGMPYPKDRKERDVIYAQKGVDPVTRSTMPEYWKDAAGYAEHLRTGGNKLSPAEEARMVPGPDLSDVKSVSQQLRESNVRFG